MARIGAVEQTQHTNSRHSKCTHIHKQASNLFNNAIGKGGLPEARNLDTNASVATSMVLLSGAKRVQPTAAFYRQGPLTNRPVLGVLWSAVSDTAGACRRTGACSDRGRAQGCDRVSRAVLRERRDCFCDANAALSHSGVKRHSRAAPVVSPPPLSASLEKRPRTSSLSIINL